jgi:hypothetical protein
MSSLSPMYEKQTKLEDRLVKQELCFLALGSSLVSTEEQKCSFFRERCQGRTSLNSSDVTFNV